MNNLKLLIDEDIEDNRMGLICSKGGESKKLVPKEALNPFSSDIRNFKTIFDINDSETMMDFGLWILAQCEHRKLKVFHRVDSTIELLYELMRCGKGETHSLNIIVEESCEELFITMKFAEAVNPNNKTTILLDKMGDDCILKDNIVCMRIVLIDEPKVLKSTIFPTPIQPDAKKVKEPETILKGPEISVKEPEISKKIRILESREQDLLRQSFVQKTAAIDYVRDIGGDVLDEIRDLESLDEEWGEKLRDFESEPTADNLREFADGVLGIYVRGINNLFEFTALAYALSSLGTFLKEHAELVTQDAGKVKTLSMLLEHLGLDLVSWREHIFSLQDTADIHYLDSSFFSSCMQIEGIIGDKEVASDDDNDMEFF
jgi:hypothetical protein